MTDATTADSAFLRATPLPAEPPPALAQGPVAWARKNLFSSPVSAVLTIAAAAFLVWVIPGIARFLFIDAVWHGDNGEICRANQGGRLLAVHRGQDLVLLVRPLPGSRALARQPRRDRSARS